MGRARAWVVFRLRPSFARRGRALSAFLARAFIALASELSSVAVLVLAVAAGSGLIAWHFTRAWPFVWGVGLVVFGGVSLGLRVGAARGVRGQTSAVHRARVG